MKEQLISFKTAKLAKEKGFDWKCYWYYSYKRKFPTNIKVFYPERGEYENFNCKNTNFYEILSAPTQCLLQKWLRENHRIHIYMETQFIIHCNSIQHYVIIYDASTGIREWMPKEGVYEEALEKGLYKALKLVFKH